MLRAMGKWGILVAACLALWPAATSAKNDAETDMIFFDVCASCDTILPRQAGLDPDDLRAAEKALKEALDSATLRTLRRGDIVTEGRRIGSVSLHGDTLGVMAYPQPDGTYRVVKFSGQPAPPAGERKPVPAAEEKKAPRWQLHTSVDRFDGAKTVMVSASADSGQDAALWVRCRNNKTDLVVTWPRSLGGSSQVIQWRIDDRPAQSETWQLSQDGRTLFAPQAIPLARQMLKAQEFAIRTNPAGAQQQSLFFRIAGLEDAIAPVRQACGW